MGRRAASVAMSGGVARRAAATAGGWLAISRSIAVKYSRSASASSAEIGLDRRPALAGFGLARLVVERALQVAQSAGELLLDLTPSTDVPSTPRNNRSRYALARSRSEYLERLVGAGRAR